jgi:hypothetical protein
MSTTVEVPEIRLGARTWPRWTGLDALPASIIEKDGGSFAVRTTGAATLIVPATALDTTVLRSAFEEYHAAAPSLTGLLHLPAPANEHTYTEFATFAAPPFKRGDFGIEKCEVYGVPCDRTKIDPVLSLVRAGRVLVGEGNVEGVGHCIVIDSADAGNWWRIVLLGLRHREPTRRIFPKRATRPTTPTNANEPTPR